MHFIKLFIVDVAVVSSGVVSAVSLLHVPFLIFWEKRKAHLLHCTIVPFNSVES